MPTPPDPSRIFSRWLVPVAAGAVIVGVGFQVLPIMVARAAVVLIVLAQVFRESRTGDGQFLTSPLFLLGVITLVFFDLVPGLSEAVFGYKLPFQEYVGSFYGGTAERIMVIFGLACIAAHSLISYAARWCPQAAEGARKPARPDIYIFAAIALAVTLVNVGNFISMKSGGPNMLAIRSMAPPLLAFCLIYLARLSLGASGRDKWLIAGVFVLSIAGLFFILEGKKPFFIMLAGLLFWLRLKNVSLKNMIVLGTTSALLAIALIQISQMIRVPHASMLVPGSLSSTHMLNRVLHAKLVARQAASRYCLQGVVDEHWDQPFSPTKQKFWLQGLMPRALWPDKPNLSLGLAYAEKYCDKKLARQDPTWVLHSASITLLGQPVIYGGWAGLLLHGGILITCLGGVMWMGRNPHSVSAIAAVAMLPWLIDFDQDFTLFVANAVKFFLVMLPLIILTARPEKNPASA